jgi:hypothetical protein
MKFKMFVTAQMSVFDARSPEAVRLLLPGKF